MAGLDFLGPLGLKLQAQGDRLDKRFCEIKGILGQIADNTVASRLLNERTHKAVTAPASEEASLLNDTGWGWVVRWVANNGESKPKVYLGAENPERFLAMLGEFESGETDWYVPSGTNLVITELVGSLNFQIELVRTSAVKAETGRSSERYDKIRPADEVPTASILQEV